MFSDIVGFTTMAEALDPETLIDVGSGHVRTSFTVCIGFHAHRFVSMQYSVVCKTELSVRQGYSGYSGYSAKKLRNGFAVYCQQSNQQDLFSKFESCQ